MKKALMLALCCMAAGGCAVNCASDWREVGMNDGRLGADSQIERYAASCGNVDRQAYAEGLQAGFAMRPRIAVF